MPYFSSSQYTINQKKPMSDVILTIYSQYNVSTLLDSKNPFVHGCSSAMMQAIIEQ